MLNLHLMNHRNILSILVAAMSVLIQASMSAKPLSPQEAYIEKYAQIAVDEMFRSGVPASITLAQGMLESSNGQSYLAVKGNNHFGIKCHDWTGGRVFFDDDRKGECFRKYRSVEDSFRDHSDFLRYRDRYKFLFDLKTTDYKGWAYGLKRAGYATDPSYPRKLINLIETYDLTRFDETDAAKARKDKRLSRKEARRLRRTAGTAAVAASQVQSGDASGISQSGYPSSAENVSIAPGSRIPESPTALEEPQPLDGRQRVEFRFSLSRQLYSQNGVAFVYSVEGETYSTIASLYSLFPKEILSFNDAASDSALLPGTVVYLQPKKKYAAAHMDKYIAEGDESLRDICQRFAVKMSSIMKLNGFSAGHQLREGDTVLLRK